jgi:hypothetical protein
MTTEGVARSFAMNSQRFSFQTAKHVIASEAKQSIARHKEKMDCFAEPVIGRAFARPVGSQ